jgi:hypothetical protein
MSKNDCEFTVGHFLVNEKIAILFRLFSAGYKASTGACCGCCAAGIFKAQGRLNFCAICQRKITKEVGAAEFCNGLRDCEKVERNQH